MPKVYLLVSLFTARWSDYNQSTAAHFVDQPGQACSWLRMFDWMLRETERIDADGATLWMPYPTEESDITDRMMRLDWQAGADLADAKLAHEGRAQTFLSNFSNQADAAVWWTMNQNRSGKSRTLDLFLGERASTLADNARIAKSPSLAAEYVSQAIGGFKPAVRRIYLDSAQAPTYPISQTQPLEIRSNAALAHAAAARGLEVGVEPTPFRHWYSVPGNPVRYCLDTRQAVNAYNPLLHKDDLIERTCAYNNASDFSIADALAKMGEGWSVCVQGREVPDAADPGWQSVLAARGNDPIPPSPANPG